MVDGIRIVRAGRQWTVHLRAFRHYRGRLRSRFDLVIDQVNTIPFFAPLWAGIPTVMMIWQLAKEVWWYESPFPLNALGYILEPLYLRAYRKTPVLTYSESTRTDLRHLGFRSDITVVPVGIEPVSVSDTPKPSEPSFVYVGRLAPSKRVDEIVEAFAMFRQESGRGRLLLIGEGPRPYVRRLMRLTESLHIADSVEFPGWLKGNAKHRRMAEAQALLMASVREGWGLVVTECNACGTPAVVYNVPGLKDSVRDGETGLVVQPSPRRLADGMLRLVEDEALYRQLRATALDWSRNFTYESGFRIVREMIGEAVVS
jgi:glycosyltransferase involved in cell wall biosynthesis